MFHPRRVPILNCTVAGGDTTNFVCDDTNNCETDLGVQCLSQSLFEQIVDIEHSTCDDDALGETYSHE